MTTRVNGLGLGFVVIAAGFLINAGCSNETDESVASGGAAVSAGDGPMTEAKCLVDRFTAESSGSRTASFFGREVSARGGDRVFVAALDAEGGTDFEAQIVGDGARFPGSGTDVTQVEIVAARDARYHFEVHDRSRRARAFRATIDVFKDHPDCLRRRVCYRGNGPQCNGIPVLSAAVRQPDGRRTLQVSVGSQLHDTCCLAHPEGVFCGGNLSRDVNPTKAGDICGAEWNRAWYDTKNFASWSQTFDPTQYEYAVQPVAESTGSYRWLFTWDVALGKPNAASSQAPSGARIDGHDADAWCGGRGTSFSGIGYRMCN